MTGTKLTKAEVKRRVQATFYVDPDHKELNPKFKRDGTIELREGYFYPHGRTPETWAKKVLADLREFANLEAEVVQTGDRYANWPKQSYFWVVVRVTGEVV